MSGFGKAVHRAWKRGPNPRPSNGHGDIEYAKDSVRMAHIVNGMWCPSCGVVVGTDDKHAPDCVDVPAERRRIA